MAHKVLARYFRNEFESFRVVLCCCIAGPDFRKEGEVSHGILSVRILVNFFRINTCFENKRIETDSNRRISILFRKLNFRTL